MAMKISRRTFIRRGTAGVAAAIILTSCGDHHSVTIHSHNDYARQQPFYGAYENGASSIECDMFYVGNDTFLVGHDLCDLDSAATFDKLYLEPLAKAVREGGRSITLMVEIKSQDPQAYVDALQRKLEPYSDIFDPKQKRNACGLLITGWHFPEDCSKYPSWFKYDYQYNGFNWTEIDPVRLETIGMISMNYGALKSREEVLKVIDFAHSLGKPVRFWNAPDNPEGWQMLLDMGVDCISTDNVADCILQSHRPRIISRKSHVRNLALTPDMAHLDTCRTGNNWNLFIFKTITSQS